MGDEHGGWHRPATTNVMRRRTSLPEALRDLEADTLSGVSRVVVSTAWWDALSGAERDDYQRRAAALGVALSADDRISRHFVELVSRDEEGGTPPLSSERRV
jgi:hypothetical protein